MEWGLNAKHEGRKDLMHKKFQATAKNLNGGNDIVSSNEYKFLRFEFDLFVLGHVFLMLRTYVMILCNLLIIWQNALYLYLGRLRMCLNTSRNHVSRSSVEAFKSVQEIKQRVQIH